MNVTSYTMNAPDILGKLDLAAIHGELILIELEILEDLLPAIDPLSCIIFSAASVFGGFALRIESTELSPIIRSIQKTCKDQEININFIIHEIDHMDLDKDKRSRGALHKGLLSQLPKRLLKGSNVIITSTREEYSIRELADRFINLRIS